MKEKYQLSRRQFFCQGTAVAAMIGAGGLLGYGRTVTGSSKRKYVQRAFALGTEVVFTVFHDDYKTAQRAVEKALSRIEHVEQLMSLYRLDSQLSFLNRNGFQPKPHPDFLAVITRAVELSRLTEGAFDITVQPLWKLYKQCSREGKLPTERELREAKKKVGWQHIELQPDLICLNQVGARVTLNGIAQGLAADVAGIALQENGIEHALIDAGEFRAMGESVHEDAWRIAIQHPRRSRDRLATTDLDDRCLATSGDYGTRFSRNYEHHHIFDPRTGLSPTELSSVSVKAPTALEADALSTALLVLGPRLGMDLADSLDCVDALFVTKDGRITQTARFF